MIDYVLFKVDGGALQKNTHQLVWVPRHRVSPEIQLDVNN